MAGSKLSFVSTESFRKELMAKNLAPYNVQGVYSPQVSQLNYETILSNYSVIDSDNTLIAQSPKSNDLYVLNQYGPTGGYNKNINYNNAAVNVNSNEGEYDINDTKLDLINEFEIDAAYLENPYGPQGGFNSLITIDDIQINNKIHLPYWKPPSFTPSTYTAFNILTNDDPSGTNGPLSSDSFIAKIGSDRLKFLFQERVNEEILQSTVGLVNLDALSDPFEASQLVTGQQPLIYKNWRITIPENPISRTGDFLSKIAGVYWPVSPIPGDYFEENTNGALTSNQTSTALNVTNLLTLGSLGPILNLTRNPSQIFLANTGNGQRSALFRSIDYNRYQPSYDRSFGGLLGVPLTVAQTAVSALSSIGRGGYYVGSKNSEPSSIISPPNQIPVDTFGRQNPTPVYGPSELGILYEGNIGKINFGLQAKPTVEGGSVSGEFVWVSPKSKGGAGYKPTVGGGKGQIDPEFNQISNSYTKGESTNISYKRGSILDQTQRLVNSSDNVSGISKLKHVGNAINQVSKVFNDGYKEMTKGSRIVKYKDNTSGEELGVEYCRVFSKDTPYMTYKDLQKSAGITKEGRRFSYSVLDNTYNLNIAPLRGENSTNIVQNERGLKYAKKYMFSIENLAWRTSSRPGYRVDDLPVSEQGPNGGRVMWFPPYDLKFNDTSTPQWQETPFLGRPEPIYTYKHTTRTGTISWKMIVDSPSVTNLLIDRQLKNVKNNEKLDSILQSFFAGCLKYDIYELAKRHNTFTLSELEEIQTIISEQNLTAEEIKTLLDQVPTVNVVDAKGGINNTNGDKKTIEQTESTKKLLEFRNFGFYFDENEPTGGDNYKVSYDKYITKQGTYQTNSNANPDLDTPNKNTDSFFSNIIVDNWTKISEGDESFVKQCVKILNENNFIVVNLFASEVSGATASGVDAIAQTRLNSVIEYFKTTELKKFIDDKKIDFKIQGSEVNVSPYSSNGWGSKFDCQSSATTTPYSVSSMACRRIVFNEIKVSSAASGTKEPEKKTIQINDSKGPNNVNPNIPTKLDPKVEVTRRIKAGIGKKVLRKLLTEEDYFDVIKEDAPFIYDSLVQRLKYFNPAFHSMTPEGLNARLTFLNQCVRPGDTIPVIGPDGKPKFNDALNTSFGTPPVLVLRIGDFYHAKVIPGALAVTYDNNGMTYDMNPEGIGVQPMIANISLGVTFIGGHGLAGPVEQLQNALSFNYYANTEIYDERAVATEDTSTIDKEIFDSIVEGEKKLTKNDTQPQPQNRGGNTIGTILTEVPITSGQTGFTSYQKVADAALSTSKEYFTGFYNHAKTIFDQYNYGIWQLVQAERNFSTGNFYLAENNPQQTPKTLEVPIYGKPKELEERLKKLYEDIFNDLKAPQNIGDAEGNPIMNKMTSFNNLFDKPTIEKLRKNLEEYLTKYLSEFALGIFKETQTFSTFQQDMVQNFTKINLVNKRTDGKILETGKPIVYNVDGTSEISPQTNLTAPLFDVNIRTLQELMDDYTLLGQNYQAYNGYMVNEENIQLLDITYSQAFQEILSEEFAKKVNTANDRRFYMIMARIFENKNKLRDFKNSLLKEGLNKVSKFEKKLDDVCDDLRDLYLLELEAEKKAFKLKKETETFVNFEKKNPYIPNKTRKFVYSTVPNSNTQTQQETDVKALWGTINTNTDNTTWEGKITFD